MFIDHKKGFVFAPPPPPEFLGGPSTVNEV